MDDQALIRLEALRKRNAARDWVNSDLYRLLFKPELYVVAYERIKSSPGNMTAGVDGETLDGFSNGVVGDIIRALRDESFQFKPARRVFIPKANGKMRPLGVASPRDKVVQEAMRMVFEAIYDSPHGAYFHDSSHGFRRQRSCHTALEEFRFKWPGVNWIIEGDIKSCFDEIDHHVLISLLQRKIADGRFLGLVWKALRAGYLWQKERRDTLLGSPQGSIISPILANVYLHELDCFVETLRQRHERGDKRKVSPDYMRVACRRWSLRNESGGMRTPEIRDLTRQMRSMSSVVQEDPDFIRIKYLRYADDWILGVIGPKELAVTLRNEVQGFLQDRLKLQLNLEKTRITHAKTEDTFFLGTVLRVGKDRGAQPKVISKATRRTRRFRLRVSSCNPTLKAPIRKLVAKLHTKGFCGKDGYPDSRRNWTPLDVDQIVRLYNSILRGLLNYYRFADNFARMGRIQYILRFSLAKTLAHKLRVPMTRVFREHGRNLLFRWELSGGRTREVSFAENTDWTIARRGFFRYPINIDLLTWHVGLRTKSKLGYPCLICGSQNGVQMHHVRHIRKMGGARPQGFTAVMARLNRKQVPVCEDCHRKIHRGDFDGISPKELAYGFAATPK